MNNFTIKDCQLHLWHLKYDEIKQVYYIKYNNDWRRDIPDIHLARKLNVEIANHPDNYFLLMVNENLDIIDYMRFGD